MIYLHSQLMDIVNAGGSIVIDMKKHLFLYNQIYDLAAMAARSGAKITIKNSNFLTNQMTDIAEVGKGNVIFEL